MQQAMSALHPIAIAKADISSGHVRFTPKADMCVHWPCLLWAKSGHPQTERPPDGGLPKSISSDEEWEQPLFVTRPSLVQADLVSNGPEVEKEFRKCV